MQKLVKRIKSGLWVAFGGFLATVISLTVENIGVFDMNETQKAIVVIIGTASSFLNMNLTKEKILTTAVKTPYYLNAKTTVASMSNLYMLNGSFNKTIIRATCAYI